MVVKGESPHSGAKVPYAHSYGGAGEDFNRSAAEGTSGVLHLIVPTLCVGMQPGDAPRPFTAGTQGVP